MKKEQIGVCLLCGLLLVGVGRGGLTRSGHGSSTTVARAAMLEPAQKLSSARQTSRASITRGDDNLPELQTVPILAGVVAPGSGLVAAPADQVTVKTYQLNGFTYQHQTSQDTILRPTPSQQPVSGDRIVALIEQVASRLHFYGVGFLGQDQDYRALAIAPRPGLDLNFGSSTFFLSLDQIKQLFTGKVVTGVAQIYLYTGTSASAAWLLGPSDSPDIERQLTAGSQLFQASPFIFKRQFHDDQGRLLFAGAEPPVIPLILNGRDSQDPGAVPSLNLLAKLILHWQGYRLSALKITAEGETITENFSPEFIVTNPDSDNPDSDSPEVDIGFGNTVAAFSHSEIYSDTPGPQTFSFDYIFTKMVDYQDEQGRPLFGDQGPAQGNLRFVSDRESSSTLALDGSNWLRTTYQNKTLQKIIWTVLVGEQSLTITSNFNADGTVTIKRADQASQYGQAQVDPPQAPEDQKMINQAPQKQAATDRPSVAETTAMLRLTALKNNQVLTSDQWQTVVKRLPVNPAGVAHMTLVYRENQPGPQPGKPGPATPTNPNAGDHNNGGTTPTEPTTPTQPTAPTAPTEPTEPTIPTIPVGPTAPIVPDGPSKPSKPLEPVAPTAPTAPSKPPKPTVPAPAQPGTTVPSATKPVVSTAAASTRPTPDTAPRRHGQAASSRPQSLPVAGERDGRQQVYGTLLLAGLLFWRGRALRKRQGAES